MPHRQPVRPSIPLAPVGGFVTGSLAATPLDLAAGGGGFVPSLPGGVSPGGAVFGSGAPLFAAGGLFGAVPPEEQAILDAPDEFFAGNSPEERNRSREAALAAVRARRVEREGRQPPVGLLGTIGEQPSSGLLSQQRAPGLFERITRAAAPDSLLGFVGRAAFGPTDIERAQNEELRALIRGRSAVRELIESVNIPGPVGGFLRAQSQIDPAGALESLGGILGIGQQQRGLAGRFSAIERRIGRPLTEEEILTIGGARPETPEGQLDQPIPLPQLQNIRLPNGQTPPLGTTFREARRQGAVVSTGTERQRVEEVEAALAAVDQLESLAVGKDGIFRNVEPGLLNRAAAAVGFALDLLDQDDPRASLFRDLSQGTVSRLIRSLGEKGALSDGDVARAQSLLPQLFPLPDSADVATKKLRALRSLIEKGVSRLGGETDDLTPAERDELERLRAEFGIR